MPMNTKHLYAVALLLLTACTPSSERPSGRYESLPEVTALGRIDAYERTRYLSARKAGLIEVMHVDVGDRVRQGQALAMLECSREREQRAVSEAALALARAEHGQLLAGSRAGTTEEARERLRAAEHRQKFAADDFERRSSERNSAFESERALSELQQQLAALEAEADAARAHVLDLEAGPRGVDREVSRARVQLAAARLAQAQADVDLCQVLSPVDGRVLAVRQRAGEYASAAPGDHILVVANTDALILRAELDERDLNRVMPGAPATLRFPGSDLTYAGEVFQFSGILGRQTARTTDPASRFDRDVLEVLVRIGTEGNSAVAHEQTSFAIGRQMLVSFPATRRPAS